MNSRWKQITRLFTKALKLDEADRQTWLEQACGGDHELLDEIQSMLRAYTSPGFTDQAFDDLQSMAFLQFEESKLKGRQVGRFQLQDLIGAGGMGVIYSARDPLLEREVAIKFPPPAWSFNENAKQRFLNEARAAASLDHPNICTIYESGVMDDGSLYMAMAYYRGETLRERLENSSPLPVSIVLDIALQTARGLAAAHAKGLVHRDIKPENLMITPEGNVKILDFGIAKATHMNITITGQQPGTAAYMAPEQTHSGEVNGRADLWALGVVFYEMLTCERPTENPEAPSIKRTEVPKEIDDLVLWLLEPDPDDRPGKAGDVIEILERQLSPVTDAPVKSLKTRKRHQSGRNKIISGLVLILILAGMTWYYFQPENSDEIGSTDETYSLAVLPFSNLGDEEDIYFSEGITDDILTHLATIPELAIISRSSSIQFRDSELPVSKIAADLGVQYVLGGSLRRTGDRIRLTAQLIDGQTEQYMWAESYDRNLEDVFEVQTDIASSIAGALEAELSSEVALRIEKQPTDDLEAYDLFLRGREEFYRYDEEGTKNAIDAFREALERDPDFALARAWLGRSFAIYVNNHGGERSWADSAIAMSQKAVEQRPDLAEAHGALGVSLALSARYTEAEKALRRALELNPNDMPTKIGRGFTYAHLGRFVEAIQITRRSLESDPAMAFVAYGNLASYYTQLELFDRAVEMYERGLTLRERPTRTISGRIFIDYAEGKYEDARKAVEQLIEEAAVEARLLFVAGQLLYMFEGPDRAHDLLERAYELAPTLSNSHLIGVLYAQTLELSGEYGRAQKLFAETKQYAHEQIQAGDASPDFPYTIGCIYALRGEVDEALQWIKQVENAGWPGFVVMSRDPLLDNLRGEPRFEAMLDRMWQRIESQREQIEQEGV